MLLDVSTRGQRMSLGRTLNMPLIIPELRSFVC